MKAFACLRPGRLSIVTLAAVTCVCLLDSLCFLPHPVSAPPPGAPPPLSLHAAAPDAAEKIKEEQSGQFGLPMAEVRRNYHKRLEAWSRRALVYRQNLTLAAAEMLQIRRPSAAVDLENSAPTDNLAKPKLSPECSLADASVREREAARVEARLQGSAGLHAWLVLRDVFVYGSLDPFTLEAMMRQKRVKMQKANGGKVPTDDEVCLALVDSSARSNKAWDEAAESRGRHEISYAMETAKLYLAPMLAVSAVAYLSEVAWSFKRQKCNKD